MSSTRVTGHPGDGVACDATIDAIGETQFFAWSGSKTAWDIQERAGVTAVDAIDDLSTLAQLAVGNAPQFVVWGKCSNPNQTATVVPVFFDESNNVLFLGDPIGLSCSTLKESASGRYVSQGARVTLDPASCSTIGLLVTQLSGGTWDFYLRGY